MKELTHYLFSVNMPYSECESLYLGQVKHVVVTADTGERIQVPSINVRKFVDTRGLVGRFRLTVDDKHKIQALVRIA
ncbi:DUF2835 family protein [Glaciecola sp. KUL10]|uniref:DUF2835 family protein n=1 Tax=Glaciecola sp. (strain KUL10) TaxID=2161813 RepID=UPI000D788302|nr:DUF2835 family protein [Glaciecola sp. KUL10]GBL02852.1 hypothetical protein KUL10_01250 [Glaciecola sp. KUL10]